MRRLVLSLLAASSVALLTACGQGGSAFNSGNTANVDHVDIQSGGNPTGVFKVVPGGTIVLSAIGVKGSNGSILNNDTNYTWTYNVTGSGALYNTSPTGTTACPVLTGGGAVLPGIFQNSSGKLTSTIQSSNATAIIVAPASPTAFGGTASATSYCLTINAIHTVDGVTGSINLYVGN